MSTKIAPAAAIWAAPLGDAAAPALLGLIEGVTEQGLEGWLCDPARPLSPVIFQLRVADQDLGRHIANLPPRPQAPGRLRFCVKLPPGMSPQAAQGAVILALDGQRGLSRPTGAAALIAPGTSAATRAPSAEPKPQPAPELTHLLDQLDAPQQLAMVEKSFQAKEWPLVLALTERGAGTALDPRLVTFRGRAFFYLGRHAEAVEALRFIQTRHPQRHTAMLFLGRALAQLGQLPEAREVLAHCRTANPAEPRYVFEAGRIAARLVQGDDGQAEPRPDLMEEATTLLRQAFEMRPEDHRPPRLLAQLALLQRRLNEALSLLQIAVALAPQQAELHMELARLLTRLNRLEEALEAAKLAAALDPLRDGAAFAVRILQRWLEARRTGPLSIGEAGPA